MPYRRRARGARGRQRRARRQGGARGPRRCDLPGGRGSGRQDASHRLRQLGGARWVSRRHNQERRSELCQRSPVGDRHLLRQCLPRLPAAAMTRLQNGAKIGDRQEKSLVLGPTELRAATIKKLKIRRSAGDAVAFAVSACYCTHKCVTQQAYCSACKC